MKSGSPRGAPGLTRALTASRMQEGSGDLVTQCIPPGSSFHPWGMILRTVTMVAFWAIRARRPPLVVA